VMGKEPEERRDSMQETKNGGARKKGREVQKMKHLLKNALTTRRYNKKTMQGTNT